MAAVEPAVTPVAGATTPPGNKTFGALGPQTKEQSADLTTRQSQKRRRIFDPQFAARHPKQRIIPRKLATAHGHHRHKRILHSRG